MNATLPTTSAATTPAVSSPAPSKPTTAQFGTSHGVQYQGLTVSVLDASAYTPTASAAGVVPGDKAVKLRVRLTNTGSAAFDPTLATVSVHAGPNGDQCQEVVDDNIDGGWTGDIPPGQSATASFAFDVPTADLPGQIVVDVNPGLNFQDAPFAGPAG